MEVGQIASGLVNAVKAMKSAATAVKGTSGAYQELTWFQQQVKSLDSMVKKADNKFQGNDRQVLHNNAINVLKECRDFLTKNKLTVDDEIKSELKAISEAEKSGDKEKMEKAEKKASKLKAFSGRLSVLKNKKDFGRLKTQLSSVLSMYEMAMLMETIPQHQQSLADFKSGFDSFQEFVRQVQHGKDAGTLPLILWVDDDMKGNIEGVEILTKYGFNILCTGSTENAVGLLRDGQIRFWRIFTSMERRETVAGRFEVTDKWAGLSFLRTLKGMRVDQPVYVISKTCDRRDVKDVCRALGAVDAFTHFRQVLSTFVTDGGDDDAPEIVRAKNSFAKLQKSFDVADDSVGRELDIDEDEEPLPGWASDVLLTYRRELRERKDDVKDRKGKEAAKK